MNLALSNFAFDNEDSDKIFTALRENNINQIECIVPKIAPWDNITPSVLHVYLNNLRSYMMSPYSVQSLFYNSGCNNICETENIIKHFEKIISITRLLGCKILVFGSPNLRKKYYGWKESLIKIFRSIDNMLHGTDINVVIEPNAHTYGGEFFHDIYEIVNFLKTHNFTHIKTMIDTHNSILENKNPLLEIVDNFEYINHIHISELDLKVIMENNFHYSFSDKLKFLGYNKTITYEVMKCDEILESIKVFSKIYH